MLLPPACPSCGRPGPAPCTACRSRFRAPPLLAAPPGVDTCQALLAYDDDGRALIAGLKYRNRRAAVPWLATGLAALVAGVGGADSGAVVTWVPTTGARRYRRGFDQSRILASAVAARVGLPCRRLLRRLPGPAQTGLSRVERGAAPRIVLAPTLGGGAPAWVVLVDDVVTTGSTVAAAAAALRAGGAARVDVVAVARTPGSPCERRQ